MVLTPYLYITRSTIKTGHCKCFNEGIPYILSHVGLPDHVALMPEQLSAICLVCGQKVVFAAIDRVWGINVLRGAAVLFDCTSWGESWI